MASVSLDIIQSGSTSATLHCEQGDTVTLELAETVYSNALEYAVTILNAALGGIAKITFAANTSGGAT